MKRLPSLALLALITSLLARAAGPSPAPLPSPLGPHTTPGKIPTLLVKGIWSQLWNLDEILASPPNQFSLTSSYVTQRYGYVFALKYFPDKEPDLLSQKVVVLANVPTTALLRSGPYNAMKPAPGRSDQWLVDFVDQGGGLLILGGPFSFDLENTVRDPAKTPLHNTFQDSALAKILPASLADTPMRFADQNIPLEITPTPNLSHPILAGIPFDDHPSTLFFHPMIPANNATILLSAANHPILILGTHGKGRIALFLATLHGNPPPNSTPYYQSKSWPPLLRNTLTWLAHSPP